MKSAHVRFDDNEYAWLKATAAADRRSVSSMIELLVLDALARSHADKKPYAPPTTPTRFDLSVFDDTPTESEG